METNPQSVEQVQANVAEINDTILLLQMERERYEQIGHRLVAAMFNIPEPRNGNNG